MVGPFNIGDADTLEVCTWSVVANPNKYIGIFLSQPEGVTPHCYFEMILPVVEADRMGQMCMPLTHFYQVVITMPAANSISSLQVTSPASPLCHIPLLTQASTIIHHHLPALNARGAAGGFNL